MSYWTTAPVSREVRAQVEREAIAINLARDWWCESLNFFDWKGKPGLAGDTKVSFASGYSTAEGDFVEVDMDEDMFLAARDTRFIVECLSQWSKAHGLTWQVLFPEPVGRVVGGAPDADLAQFLDVLDGESHMTRTPADDDRAAALLAKHVARKD